MVVNFRLEGFDVDCVSVAVVGEYDLLITNVKENGETGHIISVELDDVGYINVQYIVGNLLEVFSSGELGNWHEVPFEICGGNNLAHLFCVAFGGLNRVETILFGAGGGKSWPSGIVIIFYRLDTDGLDRKS